MTRTIRLTATRANARTAAVAALLVAGVTIVQAILQSVADALSILVYVASPVALGYPPGSDAVGSFAATTASLGLAVAPVALGVFLAFWLLVPLTAELHVGRVALRSLVASAVAAAVALAIGAVVAAVDAAATSGPLFGNAFPRPDSSTLFQSLSMTVQSALYTFVAVTPVVILVGVVVWLWVARVSPAPSGA